MLDGELQAARETEMQIDQNAPPGQRDALKEMRREISSKKVSLLNSEQNALHNQYRQQTMVELENSARTSADNLSQTLGSLSGTLMGEMGALGRGFMDKQLEFAKVANQINAGFSALRADWNSGMLVAKTNAMSSAFTNYLNGEHVLFQMANMVPDDYVTISDAFAGVLNFEGGLDQNELNTLTAQFNTIANQHQIQWVPEMTADSQFTGLMGGTFNSWLQGGLAEDQIAAQQPDQFAPYFQGATSLWGDMEIAAALG
jgi:hypothetical protein